MGTKITVEVNYEALEKLLGMENPEVALNVRDQVINTFIGSHIKKMMESDAVKETRRVLKDAIDEAVKREVGTSTFHGVKLNHIVEGRIKQAAEQAAADAVARVIVASQKAIDQKVEQRVDQIVQEMDRRLERLVDKEIDKRIKTRLDERWAAVMNALDQG